MKNILLYILVSIVFGLFGYASARSAKPAPVIHLTKDNTVILREINDVTVNDVIRNLKEKRDQLPKNERVNLVISSGGGYFEPATRLARVVQELYNLNVICDKCASSAGYIFATARKGNRFIVSNSELLIHEIRVDGVTSADLKIPNYFDWLHKQSDHMTFSVSQRMGITKEALEARILNRDWEFYGAEILRWRLGDSMVDITCDNIITDVLTDLCIKN